MIGTKFEKPLQPDYLVDYAVNKKGVQYPNPAPNTLSKYSEAAQWCNENGATIEDKGGYYEVVEIKPVEYTNEELEAQARQKRDSLIAQTDYLLMPDYPISSENLEAVKMYRQKLRDVPQQNGFPKNIAWPELPALMKE